MLFKLARKNVQTQFRSYLMYVVSMSFSVMVYYSFMGMSYDKELVARASSFVRIDGALRSAGIMIILFILFFMIAANNFFLKKRKKEIGLYSLLGMQKIQVGWLFFVENMLLGLSSLVIGIFLGILFSKFFSMILVKAIYLEVDQSFFFSWGAVKKTVMMFTIILFLISFKNARTVYRYKLVDLFKGQHKGSQVKRNSFLTWFFGLLSLLMIGSGYACAYFLNEIINVIGPKVANPYLAFLLLALILFLCVVGSYLFFNNFLSLGIVVIQNWKKKYYRDLNMVTTGALRFHLKKNANFLATIAVLCGTTLTAIGTATFIYEFGMNGVGTVSPYTFMVDQQDFPKFQKIIEDVDAQITDKNVVHFKVVGSSLSKIVMNNEVEKINPTNIISLSNYQNVRKNNSKLQKIELQNEKEVVLLEFIPEKFAYFDKIKNKKVQLTNYSEELQLIGIKQNMLGFFPTECYGIDTLVVADSLFAALPDNGAYQIVQFNSANSTDLERLTRVITKKIAHKTLAISADYQKRSGKITGDLQVGSLAELGIKDRDYRQFERNNYDNRAPLLKANRGSFGSLVYITVFLGIVFLIATGSMLMLKQLSEAEEEKERFAILRKLGVQKKTIQKSVYRQNLFVFLLPMLLAIFHAYFAIQIIVQILPSPTQSLTYMSCGFLLLLYTTFYFATASIYNKIVNR